MTVKRILGLFNDFDQASAALRDLREANLPYLDWDDVTIKSPIEHPDVESVLGVRSIPIRKYTLVGALLGGSLGFLGLATSQGNFFSQLKGGKPIIPLPPDFVLTYEMLILGGVYITVLGFLICAGLPHRIKSDLYDVAVSEDQVGVMVKANAHCIAEVRKIFEGHKVLSMQEEVVQ
ncbi:MAG TPA: quinol:electron acceptor oxidoreductase subunit ActD [Burkholderiaceae bacterium]|nr:quinol:electron acceptor oxidoreductase subunit ActD [Burkholderiaceae bacterium]